MIIKTVNSGEDLQESLYRGHSHIRFTCDTVSTLVWVHQRTWKNSYLYHISKLHAGVGRHCSAIINDEHMNFTSYTGLEVYVLQLGGTRLHIPIGVGMKETNRDTYPNVFMRPPFKG